jgi:hypothetical protein
MEDLHSVSACAQRIRHQRSILLRGIEDENAWWMFHAESRAALDWGAMEMPFRNVRPSLPLRQRPQVVSH